MNHDYEAIKKVSRALGLNPNVQWDKTVNSRESEPEVPDIREIAMNLEPTRHGALAQEMVDADADAEHFADPNGISVSVNALAAPKLSESGVGDKEKGRREVDGPPDRTKQQGTGAPDPKSLDSKKPPVEDLEFESMDARMRRYQKRIGSRDKMRKFAANRSVWTKEEEAERKAMEAFCENDANWTEKSSNFKIYGDTIPDTTTKVFG